MRRLASALVILLLAAFSALPLLACMQPDRAMSAGERACCEQMAGDCGNMPSHPCCRKLQPNSVRALLVAPTHLPSLALVPGALVPAPLSGPAAPPIASSATHSPPPSLVSISVLRI